MLKLNNWYVSGNADPYTAPECAQPYLKGNVEGHPNFEDGKHISTSPIVDAEGRVVTTRSGSTYKLGKIAPKYRKWLKENRPEWDWKIPITVFT